MCYGAGLGVNVRSAPCRFWLCERGWRVEGRSRYVVRSADKGKGERFVRGKQGQQRGRNVEGLDRIVSVAF